MRILVLCSVLLLSAILPSCTKKSDKPETAKTLVTVTNNTSFDVQAVKAAFMNWDEGKPVLVRAIGDLSSTQVSSQFEINDQNIPELWVYFDFESKTYMVTDPYPLVKGSTNSVVLSSDAKVSEIEKSSDLYPK